MLRSPPIDLRSAMTACRHLSTIATIVAVGGAALLSAQQPSADVILTNGKIITVDDKFSIAQAVAIRGERIVAVGSNQQIATLASPAARRIDLHGRAVIPGFIDNHMHLLRAGTTWTNEVRFDGVESRKHAVDLIAARARASKPGDWVYTIGGWSVDQFADSRSRFTREELDRIAPNTPVALQESYYRTYLNTRGLEAFGIRDGGPD